VNSIQAIKDKGLENDRYYNNTGTFNKPQLNQNVREISILPYESLEECNKRLNSTLDFVDLRRNLVIKDFDYKELKDKVFSIGEAKFKIIRTAPPCRYLSKLLGEDMMIGLKYIGGYRASVVKSGKISIGDKIEID
jgi:MOSC domain-containing protein YiiM